MLATLRHPFRLTFQTRTRHTCTQMVNRGAVAGTEGVDQMSKTELLGMLRFGCDRIFQVRGAASEAQ